MTVPVVGKAMGWIDEERSFVDRDTGKASEYQKRVLRVLVGDEFVVLRVNKDAKVAEDIKGKTVSCVLSAFSNEKDVVRGTAIDVQVAKP